MYKLTGLPDIAIGSWEYYKARKAFRKAKFTELSQFDDLSKLVRIKNNRNNIKEIQKQKI